MKYLYALLLAAFALTAHAQIVIQSAGAANVPVNWNPGPDPSNGGFPGVYTRFVDSLAVDVTGDGRTDIVFDYTYEYRPPAPSTSYSYRRFGTHVSRGSGVEIAYDNAGFTPRAGIRRYVAGDVIDPSVQWSSGGTLWSYTSSSGSSNTGFFYGVDGFILVRKNMGSQMRYWWFYHGGGYSVSYYAGTSVALAAKGAAAADPLLAFPNPATDRLTFSRPATYELFDCQGRRLRSSLATPTAAIEVGSLPSGIYQLVTYGPDGLPSRQRIVHP